MPIHPGQQRTIAPAQPSTGPIDRTVAYVRRFFCGLHGHDALLHFEQGRLSLMCVSCGYETPGWDVGGVPPRTEPTAVPRRLVRLPLVSERRVA